MDLGVNVFISDMFFLMPSLFSLNRSIYMQCSEQQDDGLLSFSFQFRKQHVRDGGVDGEQTK